MQNTADAALFIYSFLNFRGQLDFFLSHDSRDSKHRGVKQELSHATKIQS